MTAGRVSRFGDCQGRRKSHAGRVRPRQPHVIVIGSVTKDAVGERGLRRRGAQPGTPNRALGCTAGALDELERYLADFLRAAGQGDSDDIQDLPLGALHDLTWDIFILQIADKTCDDFCVTRHLFLQTFLTRSSGGFKLALNRALFAARSAASYFPSRTGGRDEGAACSGSLLNAALSMG